MGAGEESQGWGISGWGRVVTAGRGLLVGPRRKGAARSVTCRYTRRCAAGAPGPASWRRARGAAAAGSPHRGGPRDPRRRRPQTKPSPPRPRPRPRSRCRPPPPPPPPPRPRPRSAEPPCPGPQAPPHADPRREGGGGGGAHPPAGGRAGPGAHMPGGAGARGAGSGRGGSERTADGAGFSTADSSGGGRRARGLTPCRPAPGGGGGRAGGRGTWGPPWREKGEGRGAGGRRRGGTSGLALPLNTPSPLQRPPAQVQREGEGGEGRTTSHKMPRNRVQGRADQAPLPKQGQHGEGDPRRGHTAAPPPQTDTRCTPTQSGRAGKGRPGRSDWAPEQRETPLPPKKSRQRDIHSPRLTREPQTPRERREGSTG